MLDFAVRLPYIVAVIVGIAVCAFNIRRHPRPAALALIAFSVALIQLLAVRHLYQFVGNTFGGSQAAYHVLSAALSCLGALQTCLLLGAVFAARARPLHYRSVPAELLDFAKEQMQNGATHDQIEQSLRERGLDDQGVAGAMHELERSAVGEIHKHGLRNFIFGGLICAIGVIVTVISYALAANAPGGGQYIVTYGLVIAGAAQMIRGCVQLGR